MASEKAILSRKWRNTLVFLDRPEGYNRQGQFARIADLPKPIAGMIQMAAILFDVRRAERRLKEAGASDELAEATADLMSEAVLFNLDALVTKDHLDARLDSRFSEVDARFRDIDTRFRDIDARFDRLRAELTGEFRLLRVLLALLLAGVFIPQLQAWFGG